jgi:hypothetical protein
MQLDLCPNVDSTARDVEGDSACVLKRDGLRSTGSPVKVLAKVRLAGVSVAAGGTISALQAFTRLYGLTEPRPLVRS